MSDTTRVYDDINDYVRTFSEAERADLAAAEAELTLALLLHRARQERGLSQAAAAQLAGLHQQAISRIEAPDANFTLATLGRYMESLGYGVEITLRDTRTGRQFGNVALAGPQTAQRDLRTRRPVNKSR